MTTSLMVRHIPHPAFGTVERLIDYIDSHYRQSHHTVTTYSNYADLHFIARGKLPDEEDALKYYNVCCCVTLRDFGEEEVNGLIALARKRVADGEIRADWRDNLVAIMRSHLMRKSLSE